eukprot:SRR837773.21581.p4 GENE.SRR837773.21581~~SRR837773.21581.p4  ORF type:complete len:111 (+),score=24.99 SRR837773.21581:1-333(+)
MRQKKTRLGFGWQWKPPAEYSVSTAMPPPMYLGGGAAASASTISASAPAPASALSACAPSVLSNSPTLLRQCGPGLEALRGCAAVRGVELALVAVLLAAGAAGAPRGPIA